MPGCCAVGCTNRFEKGFRMYRFPADPVRRKVWESKVCREGWKSSSSSFLCEVHFDPQQFENGRADAKRKLKCSAVPTVFPSPRPRSSPKKRGSAAAATDRSASREPAAAAQIRQDCNQDPVQPRKSSVCEDKVAGEEDAPAACREPT